MELYLREGEIRLVIPVEKLSRTYGHLYERYASSKKGAREVIREHPYIFMIDVGGRLLSWGVMEKEGVKQFFSEEVRIK
jgi:hypothetical protein